jgi:hypothetical protein
MGADNKTCFRTQPPLFLSVNSLYLFISGVEGYCCTWSHSVTHTRTRALPPPTIHTHRYTHTHTQTHSVGLLWTRDRPVAEISTWHHTTFSRERHPFSRRDSNPQSKQAAADPHLKTVQPLEPPDSTQRDPNRVNSEIWLKAPFQYILVLWRL